MLSVDVRLSKTNNTNTWSVFLSLLLSCFFFPPGEAVKKPSAVFHRACRHFRSSWLLLVSSLLPFLGLLLDFSPTVVAAFDQISVNQTEFYFLQPFIVCSDDSTKARLWFPAAKLAAEWYKKKKKKTWTSRFLLQETSCLNVFLHFF